MPAGHGCIHFISVSAVCTTSNKVPGSNVSGLAHWLACMPVCCLRVGVIMEKSKLNMPELNYKSYVSGLFSIQLNGYNFHD